ncbi:MAG: cytochrome c3 family protein [Phycisphaerales bacterium]|nr:MAG: cytochrome c3 family protein [Phycisphaerales bacterium]
MLCILILACAVVATSGVFSAVAQESPKSVEQPARQKTTAMRATGCDVGCACCHTCDRPSPENQCLPACGRDPGLYMHGQKGPDVVVLDELQDAYLPVPFDHKGHADMAEMTRGCVVCHHYTPEGQQHPACKTCHEPGVKGTGIHKPGLKGAYHRQCLNCHKDWLDPSDCAICHRRRTSGPRSRDVAARPPGYDILEQMHPPIPEPQTEFYRAESKEGAKSMVIFRHWEHVHGFDLRCAECHHEENCTRCHIRTNGKEEATRTVREHHQPCLHCHEADMNSGTTEITGKCRRCHWQEGQPRIEPFDHTNTGWPLSTYHKGNSCRQCHEKVPFVKPSTVCNDCHGDWEPDTFDHTVTGQILDDNHEESDCAECHPDRKFDIPPTCDECHDEEISYPAQRPGLLVGPRARINKN